MEGVFEPGGLGGEIDLRGGDGGVSQEFLDGADICAVCQKVGGEGVPEEMRVDLLADAGQAPRFVGDLPDGASIHGLSPQIQ